MAFKNGKPFTETTATRRKAAQERLTWVHISKMPYMKKGQGVTFKRDKGTIDGLSENRKEEVAVI